jgi:hypothetical protein
LTAALTVTRESAGLKDAGVSKHLEEWNMRVENVFPLLQAAHV